MVRSEMRYLKKKKLLREQYKTSAKSREMVSIFRWLYLPIMRRILKIWLQGTKWSCGQFVERTEYRSLISLSSH